MTETFTRQVQELWRFLQQEIFSQPFTLQSVWDWLGGLLQKGMSFNSLAFLLFFPLCVLLYYVLPKAVRNLWLLVCSYFFYYFATVSGGRAHPAALAVLALLTLATYLLAFALDRRAARRPRRLLLAAGVLANIGMLVYVKYTSFFASLLNGWFGWSLKAAPGLSPVWMIGLSFYTLMAVGYLVDVYRGVSPAEKSPVKCALFLSFFPQVVSGPISRSGNLMHQMNRVHRYDYALVNQGLRQMLWGYFKKLVVSENAAAILKLAFASPGSYNGFQLLVSALLYAVQLYADFSGYSDIALGAARCLGFKLPDNFRRPYGARSIGEFWDRWHISLSSWLRDYLYIPLGGSRRGVARTCANTLIVFLVSGLWHGAGLTFLVWGGLHGLYNVVSRLTKPLRLAVNRLTRLNRCKKLHHFLQRAMTFCMVAFAWIFFRADSLDQALLFISRLPLRLGQTLLSWTAINRALAGIGFYANNGVALLCAILLMFAAEAMERRRPLAETVGRQPFLLRWAGYYALLLGILFFGVFSATPFIYGQF